MKLPTHCWKLTVCFGLLSSTCMGEDTTFTALQRMSQAERKRAGELFDQASKAVQNIPVTNAGEKVKAFAREWRKLDKGTQPQDVPIGFDKVQDDTSVRPTNPNSIYKDEVYLKNAASLLNQTVSGRAYGSKAIVAKPGDFPDCVALGRGGAYYASGVLIGGDVILTAAHITDGTAQDVPCDVWLGPATIDNEFADPNGTRLKVMRYFIHPEFKFDGDPGNPRGNDLMLLQLTPESRGKVETNAQLADAAEYARLGTAPWINVRAVGYGHSFKNSSGELKGIGIRRHVTIPLASLDIVRYGLYTTHENGAEKIWEFAAASKNERADTCKGDSGGPLYIIVDGIFKVVGITSRATPTAANVCGDGGVYVGAPLYKEWIDDAISKIGTWDEVK